MTVYERRIVGTPDEVRAWLTRAHDAGSLVSMTPPAQVGQGLVQVDVVSRLPAGQTEAAPFPRAVRPAPVPWYRRWSRRRWQVVSAVAAVVVGAVTWAVVVAVLWVLAHLALVVGLLLASGVLVGWLTWQRCRTCGR